MGTVAARPPTKKHVEATSCDVVALVRAQIQQVHQLLEERVLAAAEQTRSCPALHSQVLSLYAHCVCIEDITVNMLFRAMPPVFKHSWFGGRLEPWELASIQAYAQKVHTATHTLLAGLTPTDLHRGIDMSAAGLGSTDAASVLNRFILLEAAMTCGALTAKQLESTPSYGQRFASTDNNPPPYRAA
jgi:hypothetical protein